MGKINLTIEADVDKLVGLYEDGVFNREEVVKHLDKFSKEDLVNHVLGENNDEEDNFELEDDLEEKENVDIPNAEEVETEYKKELSDEEDEDYDVLD